MYLKEYIFTTDYILYNLKRKRHFIKSIIIYATKHGCAAKAAEKIAKNLNGQTLIVNISKQPVPPLKSYDTIILGGSVYIGQLNKKLSGFLNENQSALLGKNIGLFTCAAREGEEGQKQLETVFSEVLYKHAKSIANFGYELDIKKMGFFEKLIVKKIMGVQDSMYKLSDEVINDFVAKIIA